MKKILLFLCLFTFSCKVNAATYYSDYYLYQDWSIEESQSDSLTLVEEEIRYRLYNEKKVYGGYEQTSEYPLVDVGDYIEEEGNCYDTFQDGFNEKIVYYYKDLLPSRYIIFSNMNGSYGALRISELKVEANGKNIDYEIISCDKCNSNFSNYINNGVYKENMSHVSNGGSFKIDLGSEYYLSDLKISLALYDSGGEAEVMTIDVMDSDDINYTYNWRSDYGLTSTQSIDFVTLNNNSFVPKVLKYTMEIKSETKPENKINRVIREAKEYCEVIRKYRHYKIIEDYSEEYMKEGNLDYPMCDYDDFRKFYRVYKRDYLTISDSLIIDNENIQLKDFIDSSLSFDIEGEVDLNKNGVYQVIIDSPIKKVITEVEVFLKTNSLKEELAIINDRIDDLYLAKENITNSDELSLFKEETLEVYNSLLDLENELVDNEVDLISVYNDTKQLIEKLIDELLLMEEYYIKLDEQEQIIKDKNSQIEQSNNQLESLLLEIDSLKKLNQYLENEQSLLEASKKQMQENYLEEIESLQNSQCSNYESEVSEVRDTNLNLYYIGFGFIIFGLITLFIIILKKNN